MEVLCIISIQIISKRCVKLLSITIFHFYVLVSYVLVSLLEFSLKHCFFRTTKCVLNFIKNVFLLRLSVASWIGLSWQKSQKLLSKKPETRNKEATPHRLIKSHGFWCWLLGKMSSWLWTWTWRETGDLTFALEYHFSDNFWSSVSFSINQEKYGIQPLEAAVTTIMLPLHQTCKISRKKTRNIKYDTHFWNYHCMCSDIS
jgi:hypothetical protein